MPELTDMLMQQILNPQTIGAISKQLGIDSNKAGSAIGAMLPMMLAGMAKNTQGQNGANSLLNALKDDNHGSMLDDILGMLMNPGATGAAGMNPGATGSAQPVQPQPQSGGGLFDMLMGVLGGKPKADPTPQPQVQPQTPQAPQLQLQQLQQKHPKASNGDAILKHVLGDKRHTIEKGVSNASGLSQKEVGDLASQLAPLVMGTLGKVQKQNNLGAQDLQSLLNKEVDTIQKKAAPSNNSGLLGLLDADGDGDITDDLMKLGSSFFR
ncbi:MAG: DUF937 domain-containing protein [Deinococcales bacterium]